MPTAEAADTDKPNGPRSRKGMRTRARLVEAAKEVFEEDGFLNARISDIAERAGLSHGSFYHYFDSKETIFREVATELDERLSAPLNNVVLDPSSSAAPHERVRQAIRQHFEAYREEARMMGVIEQVSRYDEELHKTRVERQERERKQVADSIRRLQRRGLADPGLDPLIASAGAGAMTWRFAEMWLVQGALDCSFEEGVEQVTRLFLNALRIDDPDRPPVPRPATRRRKSQRR